MSPGGWVKWVPPWLIVSMAIVGAIGGVFSAGVLLAAWPGIPAQLETIERRVSAVEVVQNRMLCILQQEDGANPFDCP